MYNDLLYNYYMGCSLIVYVRVSEVSALKYFVTIAAIVRLSLSLSMMLLSNLELSD